MTESVGTTLQSVAAAKATETLSQFLARILDQLSISAWLPSAALVFVGGLAFSLRTVMDRARAGCVPGGSLGSTEAVCTIPSQLTLATAQLAAVGWGGALLSIAAVIVLTMVTQAFAFEAIRILEGFWGTSKPGKFYADSRSARHAKVQDDLRKEHLVVTHAAWDVARTSLIADWQGYKNGLEEALEKEFAGCVDKWKLKPGVRQRRLRDVLELELAERLADSQYLSPDMAEVLEAAIFKRDPKVKLHPEARMKALKMDWEGRSAPDLQRRRLSLAKRMRDYPEPGRESPTRLGNIMRHHEDLTGERLVEGFVIREFDNLPFSLQVDHDDQRNRLDLYSTMVFIMPLACLIAAVVLVPHVGYAIAAVGLAVLGSIVAYRAAMATARAYGGVLLAISDHVNGDQT